MFVAGATDPVSARLSQGHSVSAHVYPCSTDPIHGSHQNGRQHRIQRLLLLMVCGLQYVRYREQSICVYQYRHTAPSGGYWSRQVIVQCYIAHHVGMVGHLAVVTTALYSATALLIADKGTWPLLVLSLSPSRPGEDIAAQYCPSAYRVLQGG